MSILVDRLSLLACGLLAALLCWSWFHWLPLEPVLGLLALSNLSLAQENRLLRRQLAAATGAGSEPPPGR